jgi:hypothetical protein
MPPALAAFARRAAVRRLGAVTEFRLMLPYIPVPGGRRESRLPALLPMLMLAMLASGCSSEQVYNAAAGWRRNECYKIGDLEQRERCLKEAERPYDAYRKAAP